jgi:hypothetical protein
MSDDSMLHALRAEGPAPDRAPQMTLYGQFVGSWEARVIDYGPGGSSRESRGEWHFGWVLEGRAIQDVWIVPPRATRQPTEASQRYGTTLRVYDPKNDLWHITWINPVTQAFNRLVGRKVGNDIVQECRTGEESFYQWIFTDITGDSFRWYARSSSDNGGTWRTEAEFFAERVRTTDGTDR